MNSNLKYFWAILGLIAVLLFGVFFSLPDQNFHLIFCDVGQGDAILAIKGDNQVLIDSGPGEKVLGCLSEHIPFWDKTLEMVILTHPEADHGGGLPSVLERYKVLQFVSNSLVVETGLFQKIREEILRQKIPVYSPKVGDKIKIGNLEIEILFPLEKMGEEIVWEKEGSPQVLGVSVFGGNLNETAIVSLLKYGNFCSLLTSDIGIKQEQEILTYERGQPCQVLKVAHHGSKYSTSLGFLEEIKPELAVISVGAANRYGHPSFEVLERLRNLGIKIKRTDLDGEIEIISDGKRWWLKKR
jgi:competence protein ComEC